jgi:hypothetical protein
LRQSVSARNIHDIIQSQSLVLPAGYKETPWPGFEHVPALRASSHTTGARWQMLHDASSQRERAACRQPWLPELNGGTH